MEKSEIYSQLLKSEIYSTIRSTQKSEIYPHTIPLEFPFFSKKLPHTSTSKKSLNCRIKSSGRKKGVYTKYIHDIYLLSFFLEILAKNACKCRNRQRLAIYS